MTRYTGRTFALALILSALVAAVPSAQQGYRLFQQALTKERAEGKAAEAIQLYQRVIDEAGSDRALAAKASVQMAGCYEKLHSPRAKPIYERVLRVYADQPEAVAMANRRLTAMATPPTPVTPPVVAPQPVTRTVSLPNGAAVSPDGQYVAFAGEDLAVRGLVSGQTRTLAARKDEEAPCFALNWSADSNRLAYAWCYRQVGATPQVDVRVIGRDGTAGRVVYPKSSDLVRSLAWTPDGRSLALALSAPGQAGYRVVLVSLGDGTLREIASGDAPVAPGRMAFSADGQYLVYSKRSRTRTGIFVLALDGSGEQALLQGTSNDEFLGWTPGRRSVLFASDRSGTNDLWIVQVADGRPQGFPIDVMRDLGSLEPNGMTVRGAFYCTIPPAIGPFDNALGSLSDVYTVSLDPVTGHVASAPTQVSPRTGHSGIPIWSGDGRQLAFKSGPGAMPAWPALSILSIDSGVERTFAVQDAGPEYDWSRDGRFFLLAGGYRVDAKTGESSRLEGIQGNQPKWLPDGQSVAVRRGPNVIVTRALETGTERTILDTGPNTFIAWYAFSPDGTSIAFVVMPEPDSPGKAELKVAPVAGGGARSLVQVLSSDPRRSLSWSPDGKYVVFTDRTGDQMWPGTTLKQSELWRVPAAGGRPEKLGLTLNSIAYPSMSPDGRQLVFAVDLRAQTGSLVLENFLPKIDLLPESDGVQR